MTYKNKYEIFTWVKDNNFKFRQVSENLAALAGEDSPHAMLGKDDFDLVWKKDAVFFRQKDMEIINKKISYINQIECIQTINENKLPIEQPILISKLPIFDDKNTCIGIAGSHINLPLDYTVKDILEIKKILNKMKINLLCKDDFAFLVNLIEAKQLFAV